MFTLYSPELHQVATDVLRINRTYFGRGWSSAQLSEHQLRGLHESVRFVKESSPFYRRHLEGISDAFLSDPTFASFETLPFTTKADLRREMKDMLSRPLEDCCFFYETTGTTGPATPCPRDYVDTIYNNMAVTSCLETILKTGDRKHFVGICGPTELHSFGDTLGDVCRNMGLAMAKFWAYSPVIGIRKSIETLRDLGVTVLMCTPGMALTMAKVAQQLGYDLHRDLKLEILMLTGELGSPAMMENLGSLWGAKAYNFLYGAQEALVLATVTCSGRMHTFPMNFHYEVIDPETDEPVIARDGRKEGELVITTLFPGSKPLVRYRTGDFVRLTEAGSQDVLPSPVVEVLGRTRDALVLNGHAIQGYDLEQLLLRNVRGLVGYQLVITNDGSDRVTVQLEMLDGEPAPELTSDIQTAFRDRLGIMPTVTFGELGTIGSTGSLVSWKAARIVDKRACAQNDPAADVERRAAEQIAAARAPLVAASIKNGSTH